MSPRKAMTKAREEIAPKIFAKLQRRRRCSEFLLQTLIMREAYNFVYWTVVGADMVDIAKTVLLGVIQIVVLGAGLVVTYCNYCCRQLNIAIRIVKHEEEKATIPDIILSAYRSIKAYLPEELVFSYVNPYSAGIAATIFIMRAVAWRFDFEMMLLGCVLADVACYFWLWAFFVVEIFSDLIRLNTRRR